MNLPRKLKKLTGYTIIEMLVVLMIIGLLAAAILPTFSSFSLNQDLKSAAENLRSKSRLAQSRALSGEKTSDTTVCADTEPLRGWYIYIKNDATENKQYRLGGICTKISGSSQTFNEVIYQFGPSITIQSVNYNNGTVDVSAGPFYVIFSPITGTLSLYKGALNGASILTTAGANVDLVLQNNTTGTTQKVTITQSGEVYVN